MSSLAAARADNFYYPPGFDPEKHGSLNKFQGQHPLRDRARKLDKGILIIRFEVPFNIWCCQCGEHIAKGERFNAEKQQVGSYYSTKVLAFTMRHHCGCKITIQTDPKNAEYVVTAGAQRKVEEFTADDAQTIELLDAKERAAVAADPLARLERSTLQRRAAAAGAASLAAIARDSEAKHRDDYALNSALRGALRERKKADAALAVKRQALGLHSGVKLLPESQEDAHAAQLALFSNQDAKFAHNWRAKRQRIMKQSIFDGPTSAKQPGKGEAPRHRTAPALLGPARGASSAKPPTAPAAAAAAAAAAVPARPAPRPG